MHIKRTVFIFLLLSAGAKALAFARELLLANYYGTSVTSDIYLLSMTLPMTLFGIISVGIGSGYIPLFYEVRQECGNKRASLFTQRSLTALLLFCLCLIGVYLLFPNPLIRAFASGFSPEMRNDAVRFTNISIWAILCSCITTVCVAYLQANDAIQATALSTVPLNLVVALSIALAYRTGHLLLLPYGYVTGCVLQAGCLSWIARRKGMPFLPIMGLKDEYVKRFLKSLFYLSLGSSITQINVLIDRTLATRVMVGGLSVFEYASRISDLLISLSITPICTAVFPGLSESGRDTAALKAVAVETEMLLFKIVGPVSVFAALFARPITKLIYFRGAFDETALGLTSGVVLFYAVGLLAFGLRDLLGKMYFALSDTRTPMLYAVLGMSLNIVLNLFLIQFMGLSGLALATTVSAVVMNVMMMTSLRRRIGAFRLWSGKAIAVTAAGLLAGSCVALFLYRLVSGSISSELLRLAISGLPFVLVYAGVLCVCGECDAMSLFEKLPIRRKRI